LNPLLARKLADDRRAFPAFRGIIEYLAASDIRGWTQQTRDSVRQRRLTTAAFPGQAKNLTAFQGETDLIYRVDSTTGRRVIDAEIFDLQKSFCTNIGYH